MCPPSLSSLTSCPLGKREWGGRGGGRKGGEGEAANGNGQAEKMRPFTNMDKSQQ
jgi:hypothetical protein